MDNLGLSSVLLLGVFVAVYLTAVVYLMRSKSGLTPLTAPIGFTLVALYYYIKPMLVPNPYPTMREGMLMTFFGALAILGFLIVGVSKLRTKK